MLPEKPSFEKLGKMAAFENDLEMLHYQVVQGNHQLKGVSSPQRLRSFDFSVSGRHRKFKKVCRCVGSGCVKMRNSSKNPTAVVIFL